MSASIGASLHVVKHELFDADIMKSLLSDERFAHSDRQRLRAYYKTRTGPNEIQVVYNYGKGYEVSKLGRLYPDGGLGLQNFSRDIRAPLTEKYYWDIDIENAHFVLAEALATEWGLRTETIRYYIQNRDSCLEAVASDRRVAKVAFLRVLYGGDISMYDRYMETIDEPDGDMSVLVALKGEVSALMEYAWMKRPDVRKHCLRKRNPQASVLSIVLQSLELGVLMVLDRFMTLRGRNMDVLIHDGGLIRKLPGEVSFPDELLREAEVYLYENTGYHLRLANKPIEHTYKITKEVMYVAEGVTLEAFRAKKEEFEKTHFYLRDNGCVCEVRADGTLLMMNHDHAMRNFASVSFEFRKENMLRRTLFFPLWIAAADRREYDRLVYRPDGVCSTREYNTFMPLRASLLAAEESGAAGVERFLDIALVLANGNVAHRDYILKWIALKIQKPWVVPGVCLVFTGPQGVGKNMFWEFVGNSLIGREQFVYTDNILRDVFDTYSEAQMSNLFCLMDETTAGVTRKMANELKAKITAKMARINPKDVRPFGIDTFMSWVLLTNDASPVKLESGDRRYCVFNTGVGRKGDYGYWAETAAMFARDDMAGCVYSYLAGLDLTDFVVNEFPVTELRAMMLEAERPVEESFLRESAAEIEGDIWRGTNQEFYCLYAGWCKRYEIRPMSAVAFGRAMTPYVLKGWIANAKSNGEHQKLINAATIKGAG